MAPEELARELLDSLGVEVVPDRRSGRDWRRFKTRLEEVERALLSVFGAFADSPELRARQPRPTEWLLDNEHVVELALRQVRDSLPRRFYTELPRLAWPDGSAVRRVEVLADAVVRGERGHRDPGWLERFVDAYQRRAVLTIGELWALPAVLRLAVLERLAAIGLALVPDTTGTAGDGAPRGDPGEAVADCVLGLRFLAKHDWKEFFERVSLVDAALREDPAGVYAGMDFATRDSYRKAVERLARGSGLDEPGVARAAVERADEADARGVHRHVGHHLVDAGIRALEARIGYRVPPALRLRRLARRRALLLYLLGVLGLTGALTTIAAGVAGAAELPSLLVALLTVVALAPASAVAVGICNYLASLLTSPWVLPKLDADWGIDAGHEAMVVVPCLLTDAAEIRDLLHDLEVNYLGNRDPRLHFALLTDLSDAQRAELPDDERVVEIASASIRSLNRRHGAGAEDGPFHLLHRPRRWNPAEGRWMGWERKRGKLTALNRLLVSLREGAPDLDAFSLRVGNTEWLRYVAFVITLDADTFLPPGGAARLIATMAHPLNRARFSEDGRVEAGYTVLQPRVEVNPRTGNRTAFAGIFTGDRGLDLYNSAVSDAYQDLFGEGNFAGKGIYDPAAFERSLRGRAPENRLLSHDLFEGVHGRAGLVSDVMVLEDPPADFLAHARRTHRWIRGDWQLLPWLLPRVPGEGGKRLPNVLSLLDRWKILDNLRRSLLAPSLLVMLAGGWALLPGIAWLWTLLAAASLAVPVLLTATIGLQRIATARPWIPLLPSTRHSLKVDFQRWVLTLAFLPHEALMSVDAIARTLWRLTISKRRRLEWTTATRAARESTDARLRVWRRLAGPPLIAVGLAVLLGLEGSRALGPAAPLLLLWVLAPELATRTARELRVRIADPPEEEEVRRLRAVAHRTWQFFERTVTAEDHWLPPDHYQEEPGDHMARRTSPTNIGMLLLGTVAAWDLGYLTTSELAARAGNTLGGVDGLPRHRGHLFNWYDTTTREALLPAYVSTVDSGNLAASLVVLQHACLETREAPVIRAAHTESLVDAVEDLRRLLEGTDSYGRTLLRHHVHETCTALRDELATQHGVAQRARWILTAGPRFVSRLGDALIALADVRPRILEREELTRIRIAAEAMTSRLDQLCNEIDGLLPWLAAPHLPPALLRDPERPDLRAAWTALASALERIPSPRGFPAFATTVRGLCGRLAGLLDHGPAADSGERAAQQWLRRLEESVDQGERRASHLAAELVSLAGYCRDMVDDMDFGFLLDRHRGVFHLGYNVTAGTLDGSYYDLLASEARLASFLAIAKGDVPPDHWLSLGRPFGRVEGMWTLLSWSGTSFEYLMPSLFMETPLRTLLGRSCDAAVGAQISFASRHGVPWGISESGYHELDAESRYRYRAFGVPGLGLAGSLGERLVISPYASILALPFRPRRVLENLDTLAELGSLGRYGLFEAVDFGRTTAPPPRTGHVVHSYMAHHQGMIMAAIGNRLCDGSLQRRFHLDRRVRTAEPLVHERLPDRVPGRKPLRRAGIPGDVAKRSRRVEPWLVEAHHPCPQLNLLSNGRLRVLVSASGAGATWWESTAVTRWAPDAALGTSGHWIYLQDRDRDELWSVGSEPTRAPRDDYEATFGVAACEIMRRSHGILARMRVTVAPDEDIEVRRLELRNETDKRRRLQVTGCAEVLLAPDAEARRHPAFAKLFVESSLDAERGVLLFRRRPKSDGEPGLHLAHAVDVVKGNGSAPWYETDRERFFGRLGSAAQPAGLTREENTAGTLGATLDPVMVMGRDVEIPPRGTAILLFLTAVSRSREAAVATIQRYRSPWRADAVARRAREQGEHDLHELGIPGASAPRLQELASALLFPRASLRAPREVLASNRLCQRDLWRFGISGDVPILLVIAADTDAGSFLDPLIRGHARWLRQGLSVDLVILDDTASGYARPLRDRIRATVEKVSPQSWSRSPAGVHLIERDQVGPGERILLESTARAVLRSDAGPLTLQLAQLWEAPQELPRFVPVPSAPIEERQKEGSGTLDPPADLIERSELGGFTADGREYVINLDADRRTPAPWANVIANPEFGCLVTESGGGCTWSLNSSENRLTTWHNDPVLDPPSEVVYLRDEETGHVWSATPAPCPGLAPYQVRHGAGCTIFRHESHGLEQELEISVDRDDPVKIVTLRVRDLLGRPRRLTATYYAEWVLGSQRADSAHHVVPEYEPETGALLVRNPFHADTAGRVAFLAASRATHGVTADRVEFLGSPGSLRSPAALQRVGLSGRVEPGRDPCGALQVHLDVAAGDELDVHFLLGQAKDRDAALDLVRRFQPPTSVARARERSVERWDEVLGAVTVETPDPAMNVLLNRWLLYQATSCRMWGRTGLYQSSGAFGFRDQLQDSLALLWAAPGRAREHLLRAAAQQFTAGDVLHWWHPPGGHGVRTRCSDDLLWLPFVTAEYVRATGDAGVLDERIPFLVGEPLEDDEHERYAFFESGGDAGPLYEHCLRAIRRGTTAGAHGLPLMGGGDWNDGFNRVGIEGRGESVWLGWFLHSTLRSFAPLCEERGDSGAAAELRKNAEAVRASLEESAWDGQWYRRAYFDDGTPLGSRDNPECRIDLTAQTWAVLSGGALPERQRAAMESVQRLLVRDEDRLVLLLTPPFDTAPWDPGYVKGYPPGVRENGGQYTHAATWAAWAFAELGDGDRAWQLFDLLNPVRRHDSPEDTRRYRVEPYVLAGDVYGAPPHVGRGGWTWYTGSASWMYRLGIEAILGLRQTGDGFSVDPRIPARWPGFRAVIRHGGARYEIRVDNAAGTGRGVAALEMDGETLRDGPVPWTDDDATHLVTVRLGQER